MGPLQRGMPVSIGLQDVEWSASLDLKELIFRIHYMNVSILSAKKPELQNLEMLLLFVFNGCFVCPYASAPHNLLVTPIREY